MKKFVLHTFLICSSISVFASPQVNLEILNADPFLSSGQPIVMEMIVVDEYVSKMEEKREFAYTNLEVNHNRMLAGEISKEDYQKYLDNYRAASKATSSLGSIGKPWYTGFKMEYSVDGKQWSDMSEFAQVLEPAKYGKSLSFPQSREVQDYSFDIVVSPDFVENLEVSFVYLRVALEEPLVNGIKSEDFYSDKARITLDYLPEAKEDWDFVKHLYFVQYSIWEAETSIALNELLLIEDKFGQTTEILCLKGELALRMGFKDQAIKNLHEARSKWRSENSLQENFEPAHIKKLARLILI